MHGKMVSGKGLHIGLSMMEAMALHSLLAKMIHAQNAKPEETDELLGWDSYEKVAIGELGLAITNAQGEFAQEMVGAEEELTPAQQAELAQVLAAVTHMTNTIKGTPKPGDPRQN